MSAKRLLVEGAVNFCYCDESGTGQEPIATMVGIVVDAGRMHLTKSNWTELLGVLRKITGKEIAELHTSDFYSGNGVWRDMDGQSRSDVITEILKWLADRKHHIVYSSVVKQSYLEAREAGTLPKELDTTWRFLGFHLTLAIQRYSQSEERNKGNTFLVFDNQERERVRFNDIVKNPPEWSDAYYGLDKKQQRLDQIIDVPAFQDSKEVELLQVADFLAFFLRRHAEIQEGLVPAKYHDEQEKMAGWIAKLRERSISVVHIYPKVRRTDAHNYFYRYAPPSIRNL